MSAPVIIVKETPQPSTGSGSPSGKSLLPGGNPLPLPGQLGEVWLAAVNAPRAIAQRIWVDKPFTPTESGFGGWTVVPHEGSKGAVEYAGPEPDRYTGEVVLDGWSEGRDIQADWDALCALAQEPEEGTPPPEVWLSGTVPPAVARRPWLIEKLVPGEEEMVGGEHGERLLRARATITLIEPVSEQDIASPIKQAQAAGKASKASRTITARPGDTLVRIAARELGNPERWREISKLNGNLQPDNVKASQKIKLPS